MLAYSGRFILGVTPLTTGDSLKQDLTWKLNDVTFAACLLWKIIVTCFENAMRPKKCRIGPCTFLLYEVHRHRPGRPTITHAVLRDRLPRQFQHVQGWWDRLRLAVRWHISKRRNAKVFNQSEPLQSKLSTAILIRLDFCV